MACECRYTCDRCHMLIPDGERTAIEVTTGLHRHADPVDLCRGCGEAFRAWLASAAGLDAT